MIYNHFLYKECSTCENEEINAEDAYCKICGKDLQNYCENDTCPIHIKKAPIPSDARFCPICGKKSRYYKQGLLLSWEDYRSQIEDDDLPEGGFYPVGETINDDLPEGEFDPFNETIDDDDLPF